MADNEKELEAQSSTSLVLLAVRLIERGERRRAEQVLQCAWRMAPNDFWVNYEMSRVYRVGGHYVPPESAIRYGSAAVAIRPRSFAARLELGIALGDAGKLPEAAAQFREVVKIRPDDAYARNNLAATLARQGKHEEAMSEFREAMRLRPDYVSPHDGLGNVLCSLARPAEAVKEYRTVLRLQPDFVLTYGNLSYALRLQRKFDEAIEACRTALRLQAYFPEAQYSLALALRGRGQFAEAVAEMRKARDMAPKDSDLLRQIVHTLAATERQAALVSKLPAIVAAETGPRDAGEMVDLAQICSIKGLNGASARFWAEAFRANPKIADDVARHWRYSAACAAALAGCGRGNDQPPLDDASRAAMAPECPGMARSRPGGLVEDPGMRTAPGRDNRSPGCSANGKTIPIWPGCANRQRWGSFPTISRRLAVPSGPGSTHCWPGSVAATRLEARYRES